MWGDRSTTCAESIAGARQRRLSAHYVDFLLPGPRLGEAFRGALARRFGPLNIDLLDAFSRLGQHRNLLAPNLDKTAADGHLDLIAILLDKAQLPYLQRGQKRYVSSKNAETPLATGRLQAGYLPRVGHPLWRDNL